MPLHPTTKPRRRQLGRPRGFDLSILFWLAEVRAATTQTLIVRFWKHAGKASSYGYSVVARLAADGLLNASPLIPELGRASVQVLTLTPAGWAAVGVKATPAQVAIMTFAEQRDAWCQLASMLTERQAAGWTVRTGSDAWLALRRQALARYRARALTGTDVVMRTRLERAAPLALPCPVLWHEQTSVARLVVHVMPDRSLRAWLIRLPDLRLLAPFDIEVVCGKAVRLEEVNTTVRRWAQSRRMTVTQHYAPPFMATPHPRGALATGHDKYRETLGRSVHQLVRPPI